MKNITDLPEANVNHITLYCYRRLHYWNLLTVKRRKQIRVRSLKSMGCQL